MVYSIPCGECNVEYIGETSRALETRKKEHQAAVRLAKTKNSALAEHAHTTGHAIKFQDTTILGKEHRWHQRKWEEACHIAKRSNILFNRDSGRILPSNYLSLIGD